MIQAIEFAQTSAILEFYNLVSIQTISPQSTCHSAPICKILSKSDHPRQKKMTSCQFSRQLISAILDFRGPITGSLKSPCTKQKPQFQNAQFLRKSHFCILATDRQTNRQTDEQMDSINVLSHSRYREWRLNNGRLMCAKYTASSKRTTTITAINSKVSTRSPAVAT